MERPTNLRDLIRLFALPFNLHNCTNFATHPTIGQHENGRLLALPTGGPKSALQIAVEALLNVAKKNDWKYSPICLTLINQWQHVLALLIVVIVGGILANNLHIAWHQL